VTVARLPWLAQPIPSAGFACHLPWNSPRSGSSAGLVQTDSARDSDNQEPGIRRRLFIMRLLDPLCLYSGSTLQEADKSLINSHRSCEFPFHVKHYVRAELMALILGGHSGRPRTAGAWSSSRVPECPEQEASEPSDGSGRLLTPADIATDALCSASPGPPRTPAVASWSCPDSSDLQPRQ